jgi:hypothetical protein
VTPVQDSQLAGGLRPLGQGFFFFPPGKAGEGAASLPPEGAEESLRSHGRDKGSWDTVCPRPGPPGTTYTMVRLGANGVPILSFRPLRDAARCPRRGRGIPMMRRSVRPGRGSFPGRNRLCGQHLGTPSLACPGGEPVAAAFMPARALAGLAPWPAACLHLAQAQVGRRNDMEDDRLRKEPPLRLRPPRLSGMTFATPRSG